MPSAIFRRAALVCLGVALLPALAQAQLSTGRGGGNRDSDRTRPGSRPQSSSPAPASVAPKEMPRQRLDPGAMLCQTEADLAQHETAIAARLDGNFAAEPLGCRPVRLMTPVTVLERRGPARTHVKLSGKTEESGWTDAAVRN